MNLSPGWCRQLAFKADWLSNAGKKKKELADAFKSSGKKRYEWDSKDKRGRAGMLADNEHFSEAVARAINFPDDHDTIMLMMEALPKRGLVKRVSGRTGPRNILKEKLETLDPPAPIHDAITKYSDDLPEEKWHDLLDLFREEIETNPDFAGRICEIFEWPLPFSLVLREELKELDELRRRRGPTCIISPNDGADTVRYVPLADRDLNKRDLLGLAFSGGGIRSATFNLGVLQGLAELEIRKAGQSLLNRFDYISTVSGGGYIGSWLAGWTRTSSFTEVQRSLSPTLSPDPEAEKVRPISFLRRYSNYLTPQLGLLSADSWTMAAVYLRNVTLNLAILVAGIATILLVPRLVAWDIVRAPADYLPPPSWFRSLSLLQPVAAMLSGAQSFLTSESSLLIPALFFIALSGVYIALNLAAVTEPYRDTKWYKKWLAKLIREPEPDPSELTLANFLNKYTFTKQDRVQFVTILLVLSTYLLSKWFWYKTTDSRFLEFSFSSFLKPAFYWEESFYRNAFIFILALILFTEWFSGFIGCYKKRIPDRKAWKRWSMFFAIGLTCAFMGVLLLYAFAAIVSSLHNIEGGPWHLIVIAPTLLMLFFFLVATLLLGLMGVDFPDAAREWLSRFRAWTHIYTFIWLAVFSAAIYAPKLVALVNEKIVATITVGWLVTTVASVLAAKNPTTGLKKEGAPTSTRLDLIAKIGPPVFLVGFIILIGFLLHLLISKPYIESGGSVKGFFQCLRMDHWAHLKAATLWTSSRPDAWVFSSIFPLFLLLGLVTLILSLRVDINEFSMHHFYKNRLVRCYLGASNQDRKPNPFTGFDEKDDFFLKDLCPSARPPEDCHHKRPPYTGPYPIINATLNLTTGDQLAWQERKATSFVFTPRYCGFEVKEDRTSPHTQFDNSEVRPFGFRATSQYAYPCTGIHTGTASAISGAAVNPNQGYHTSTAVAFLLTVFNVRLGWWLGNPRSDRKSKVSSPTFGLTFLVKELLGLTDDKAGFVSLTDGGHFENLGIYELVRRRCKYIVACDAEQDASLSFNALANAVRKCRTDFGVEIDIQPQRIIRSKESDKSLTHCVVGTIRYPDLAGKGLLIYLKASLVGDEPEDVLEYATAHKEFPHQSTGDQWFDESQFESYRKLGFHIAQTTFEPALFLLDSLNLKQEFFFEQVESKWYPPSSAISENAAKHTKTYMQLIDILREDIDLAFLDAELFPTKKAVPTGTRTEAEERKGFYFCISLIQLLEDIYTDFKLEDMTQKEHPHVNGWISMYRGWVKKPSMKKTWERVENTYNPHFRAFWNDLQL